MKARGWTVSWLGTTHRHGEPAGAQGRAAAGHDRLQRPARQGLLGWLTGGLRLQKAFWDCRRILRRRAADAVLGMGGYVCFPGGLMAARWASR
jgi:UDP-N-acetylglucosamine--N-acetylmuramyl-(pentapeptide) pyrophosphoryl-undecaprenol N-acetylglucosamine transferase